MTSNALLNELIRAHDAGDLEDVLKECVVDRDVIECLKSEVDFHVRSDARRALDLAELAVRLIHPLEDPVASAIAFRSNAVALYSLGRFAEALELWEAARDAYASENMTAELAAVQRSMVDVLMYLGRYEESLRLAEDTRTRLAALGDTLGLARLDTNVGNVYHRMDLNAEALEHYERAMAAFEGAGDSFGIALSSFNAANIYANIHEFAKARERYRLAEETYKQKDMKLAAAQARYSLGYLHFLTGSYHQAMRTLDEVKDSLERLGDARAAVLCSLDLSEIYLHLNVLEEAAELASTAEKRFSEMGMRYESAKALTFRGLAFLGLARFDDAEAAFVEAGERFDEEGNRFYVGMIAAYRSELELRRGSTAAALERVAEARSVFQRQDCGARLCHARLIEARALRAGGDIQMARSSATEILAEVSRLDAPWLEQQVHELIGDILLDSGDRLGAYEHYVAAVNSIEERRAEIRVDEFRSAFFRDKLQVYEKLIRLCVEAGTPEKKAEAFYFLESRRARTLVDMLTNDLDSWLHEGSPDSDPRRDWNRLRAELHCLYARLNENESRGESRSLALEGSLAMEIRNRERALADVWKRAQISDPDFVQLERACGLSIDELREALGPGDTLIEYYAGEGGLMAFVVDERDLHVSSLGCTIDEVREQFRDLQFLLEKFQYGPAYVESHSVALLDCVNESLRWFHEKLFAPLAPLVEGRNLVIVPFDVLHNLPFHAMYDGKQHLIDRYELSYAPSARLYVLCRTRAVRDRMGIAVFGVPDEMAPRIREEVEGIRDLFPEARCFVGDAATREALVGCLDQNDILHIASHAIFRQDNPMFSAFRLADQWVSAYDVCSLRMPSTLVTLSGCSTGAGRVYAGDEMLGLIRGFLKAGASSLVVTLWPVNDPAAANLMGTFYESLRRGNSCRRALRQAVLDLKKTHSNPYYWAPFFLIGQN